MEAPDPCRVHDPGAQIRARVPRRATAAPSPAGHAADSAHRCPGSRAAVHWTGRPRSADPSATPGVALGPRRRSRQSAAPAGGSAVRSTGWARCSDRCHHARPHPRATPPIPPICCPEPFRSQVDRPAARFGLFRHRRGRCRTGSGAVAAARERSLQRGGRVAAARLRLPLPALRGSGPIGGCLAIPGRLGAPNGMCSADGLTAARPHSAAEGGFQRPPTEARRLRLRSRRLGRSVGSLVAAPRPLQQQPNGGSAALCQQPGSGSAAASSPAGWRLCGRCGSSAAQFDGECATGLRVSSAINGTLDGSSVHNLGAARVAVRRRSHGSSTTHEVGRG